MQNLAGQTIKNPSVTAERDSSWTAWRNNLEITSALSGGPNAKTLVQKAFTPLIPLARSQVHKINFEAKSADLNPIAPPEQYALSAKETTFKGASGAERIVWEHITPNNDKPTIIYLQGNTGHLGDLGVP